MFTSFLQRLTLSKRPLRHLPLFGVLVLLSACGTLDSRDDASFQQQGHAEDRPTQRPVRSMSSFSDSLQCMDKLFRDAQIPTTLITSKQIPDFSTRVPVATKEMVVTALLQMSRTSNVFRYVDYEVDIARQDTVQNLTNILLNNNQIQLQRPSLYVSGAVSFVDQNVVNNRFDVGTSASRLETGYSRNRTVTIIGLEMHLGDFRTRTMIPGLDSANEVIIGTGGQGLDLAGRISDYGWQFNVGRDYAQGSGAAIRTLVELAMIELAGKWARVPYWQCLTMDQTHPGFQRQLLDWYEEGSPAIHEALVWRSLSSKGYLPARYEVAAKPMLLRQAIGRYQADQGMVVTGVLDFSTYERALRDYVRLNEKGQLERMGWSPNEAPKVIDSVLLTSAPKVELQLENIMLGRNRFQVGEQVFLSATVNRQSHLACYMVNTQGGVMRLLPNPVVPQTVLTAGRAIRIPDWMSPNPGFVLQTANAGDESVWCAATEQDAQGTLPDWLKGPALVLLPNVQGIEPVRKAYQTAVGQEALGEALLTWQVQAPAAAPAAVSSTAPAP